MRWSKVRDRHEVLSRPDFLRSEERNPEKSSVRDTYVLELRKIRGDGGRVGSRSGGLFQLAKAAIASGVAAAEAVAAIING